MEEVKFGFTSCCSWRSFFSLAAVWLHGQESVAWKHWQDLDFFSQEMENVRCRKKQLYMLVVQQPSFCHLDLHLSSIWPVQRWRDLGCDRWAVWVPSVLLRTEGTHTILVEPLRGGCSSLTPSSSNVSLASQLRPHCPDCTWLVWTTSLISRRF